MPYKTTAELPENVTNVLPSHAQRIFMKAFNASEGKYGEDRARKIAWSAVKKAGYKKDKDGKWTRESISISLIAVSSQWARTEPVEALGMVSYHGSIDKSGFALSDIEDMEFTDSPLVLAEVTENEKAYNITAIQINNMFDLPLNIVATLSRVSSG